MGGRSSAAPEKGPHGPLGRISILRLADLAEESDQIPLVGQRQYYCPGSSRPKSVMLHEVRERAVPTRSVTTANGSGFRSPSLRCLPSPKANLLFHWRPSSGRFSK